MQSTTNNVFTKSPFTPILDFSNWKPILAHTKKRIKDDELRVSFLKNPSEKNAKLSFSMGASVLKILKLTEHDKVMLMQNPENERQFLLVKAERGYALTWKQNQYARFVVTFKSKTIAHFPSTLVEYSIHPHNMITFYL